MSILSLQKLRGSKAGSTKTRCGEVIESELLPRVFEEVDSDATIHVLDVGNSVANTLGFLNQYPCKVYFLDLEGATQSKAPDAIPELFSDYSGELFDVCLFWDLLHRLDRDQLTQLSNALEPYIYSNTRAFSILNYIYPDERYRIIDRDQLELDSGRPQSYHITSLTELDSSFPCMSLKDDAFGPDGRLEILLQTR